MDEKEAKRIEEEAEKRILETQQKEKYVAEMLAKAREKRPLKEVNFIRQQTTIYIFLLLLL